jgi:hypothetical protein
MAGGLAYVACNMGFAPGHIAVHRTAGPSAPPYAMASAPPDRSAA